MLLFALLVLTGTPDAGASLMVEGSADYSRTLVQKLIKDGMITVNGKPTKPSHEINLGDKVVVHVPKLIQPHVVASDIPGYREVVRDGIDGLLVRPNDPPALAAALRRILGDPALASTLAGAGIARAHAYSWDRVTPQLETIHRRVVAAHGSRAPAPERPFNAA